jgi:predicted phage terminase large subunit-like protein
LSEFLRAAWPQTEPGQNLLWNWHIDDIIDALYELVEGHNLRLIVNIPPRCMKSLLVSVMLPCWIWAHNPTKAFMFGSYSFGLSRDHAYKRRTILHSDWYRQSFDVHPAGDRDNLAEMSNTHGGMMYSTSVSGTSVGRGADYLLLDDPNNPKETESEVVRESTLAWFRLNWATRANQKDARWLIIQQRTHEQDITGFCLQQGGWKHLKIPMYREGASATTRDPRTKEGDLMWPERFGLTEVDPLRRTLGPYGTSGQLQQNPAPAEGGLIKRAWIRHYEEKDGRLDVGDYKIDPMNCVRFCTVDPAVTEKDLENQSDPDYTVMAAWALFHSTRGTLLLLLDLIRDRMEGPSIIGRLKAFHDHWKFAVIGIESIAFQKMLFQQAKKDGLPVREIGQKEDSIYRIDRDKTARALGATPLMADGRFYVPTYAPWLGDAIRELTLFPNAAHDDVLDCVAYGCALAEKVSGYIANAKDEPGGSRPAAHDDRDPRRDDPPPRLEGWRASDVQGFRYGR